VVCAAPELRAHQGAFYTPDLGEDWRTQRAPSLDKATVVRGPGVVVEDFDGDGRWDVFLPNPSGVQWLRQDANGTLVDATELSLPGGTLDRLYGAAAADLDGDGDVDIVVPRTGMPNGVLFNDGSGSFHYVSESIGITQSELATLGASVADYDGDDVLDLFFPNHTTRGEDGPIPPDLGEANALYRGIGDGSFEEVSEILPPEARDGYSFIGAWHDFDVDGDLDLYVVNDYGQVVPNNVYWNDGGAFSAAEHSLGLTLAGMTMGLGIGDLNDDDTPDLALSDYQNAHVLLSASDGRWYDSAISVGVTPDLEIEQFAGWGTELADFDHDTDLDLMMTFGPFRFIASDNFESPEDQPDAFWLQNEEGGFEAAAADWGLDDTVNGRGVVVVDFDRNGFLDVFKADLDGDPVVAHFARCDESAWLAIQLTQPGGNPSAIGARVEVDVDGKTLRRWVQIGSTNLASSAPPEVHFGLASADRVDALRVFWPDGEESAFTAIRTRQFLGVDRAVLTR